MTRPYRQPQLQNGPFSPSRCSSEACNRELDTIEDEVTVDCQKGQETLKDFLMLAESRGMRVSTAELKKVIDDVIAAVYSNGKYPFIALYDIFQDQSSTGKMGSAGETGILQLFREQPLLKDLATCPEIEPLLALINDNLPAMTAKDKAHLYFCLNYLGIHEVHANHPVMHKLFYVLTEPAGGLDFEDICKFKLVLETISHQELVRNQLLLPHYRHLNSVGILNGLEKQQFVRAMSYSPRLYNRFDNTYSVPVNFSQIWHALVTDEDIMNNPENIVIILNHFGYHAHQEIIPYIVKTDIYGRIEGAILRQLENMDIKTLGKLSEAKGFMEFTDTSRGLKSALPDHLQRILHSTSNMNTVDMLSVMNFYRISDFQLPQDALAILIQQIEKNFPELKLIHSIAFLNMLCIMMRKHKNESLPHFDRLMTLMNTDSKAEMFASKIAFERLVIKWKLLSLTPEAFKTYIQQNLLLNKGFGTNRRWLPVVLQVMEKKFDDYVLKKDLKERIFSVCEGEMSVNSLLCMCFSIHHVSTISYNLDINHEQIEFYKEILQLFNRKLADTTDLKVVAECFTTRHDIRKHQGCSVMMKDALENLIDRTSALMLLPHQQTDAVSLAKMINHHFYRLSKEFFHLTTPAVDQLVTNLLAEEQTCGTDDFVTLTNLIASGVMSKSKRQQLEQFADMLFEENMDFMNLDALLLGLDNLCLAGVFPPKTLTAVMSPDFLTALDQCISEKSHRVISREHIEYHLLRLNRSVVFECPALHIPWFCGKFAVVHRMPRYEYLQKFCKKTENVLLEILGGEKFLSVNSITRFKHSVDFQCFISPQGFPVALDRINFDLPVSAGIQKIAIDVIPSSLWGNELDVMYQEKKRHLKKEDYKYIQVKKDHMCGLALSGTEQLREYYTEQIFVLLPINNSVIMPNIHLLKILIHEDV
ncbi:FAST kinase domain-containing protein 1 [Mizuhopecten yessoensis]|uniref:FAST kinase domain-containing protein 1 n=1 Tax=Mizuhopecten yessoensis TaxID=6573 RepID=A0A210QVV6_MIZYE|nr:FAST kinase domain-containing protein 1 [Mizuhopecten yessoensis]